ncbi:MAG: YdgA family protein [Campylobacteraceae bacterium]|jgi:uncharacterized protein YdgA (DUF945 family)|nr:YdgA family protein [Campylobacteraceae bacterium]
MKKFLFLILGLLVVVVGFFAFSIFYSKSKVDLFFNTDNKSLYNKGGITWKLNDFESKIFNGKYTTELSIFDEKIAVFEHEAKFGLRGLNILNIGSIETTAKIYDFDNIERIFNLSSDVKFNGINTKVDIKENSKELDNDAQKELFVFSWKDIKANYFTSFERDVIDFNANIPYFSALINAKQENVSFVIENQKYSSYTSKRKVGMWLGNSLAKIGKISVTIDSKKENYDYYGGYYDDDYDNSDYYSYEDESDNFSENNDYTSENDEKPAEIVNTNVELSGIDMLFSIEEGNNLTISSNNKLSLENFALGKDETNLTLNDIVFDISLQNIDLDSMKKIMDSFDNVDLQDDKQLVLLGMSFIGYAPNILAKHPKLTLNELSIKYGNQTHKIDGFIQYIGNGDLQSLYKNIKNDLIAKFNISVGQTSVREILRKQFEGDSYETEEDAEELLNKRFEELKELGFELENNEIKGTIEYKNNALLINGKSSILLEILLASLF